MNFWQQNRLPKSWKTGNTTHKWMGSDTEAKFAANPISKWQDVEILYKYNSDGFRTHEFSDFLGKKINIALGCSFTEGIGIPIENAWPSLIEKKLNIPLLNLGLGGGTTDTVSRILTNVSGLFQIQKVFILWPEKHRFEYYDEHRDIIDPIGPWNTNESYLWNMARCNSLQRLDKNKNIVELLSKCHGFEVIELSIENVLKTILRIDPARDGMHYGINPNIELAELFLSLIKSQ